MVSEDALPSSLAVFGISGTGKTYFVNRLVAKLRETEKVTIVSRCHVAARLHEGGMTADAFVIRHTKKRNFSDGWDVREEVFQFPHFCCAK